MRSLGPDERIVIIDPADSSLLDLPDFVTFRDPARWDPTRWPRARFVPHHPLDKKPYNELYARIYDACRIWVLLDEARNVLPSNPPDEWWPLAVLIQGRKRSIGHLCCNTRPVLIDREIISSAEHVACWALQNRADRDYVAEAIGVPRETFSTMLAQLPEHGFIYYRRHPRILQACAPLG